LAKRGVEKALQRWEATADYLSKQLPTYHFHIVPMGFDEIPPLVSNNLVDFVIVNPAIYVSLAERYNVDRIATLKFSSGQEHHISEFGSVIFTHQSRNDLKNLKDLRNQSVAGVHETSLGGWIMAEYELYQAGITQEDFALLSFLETHDDVVYHVQNKQYDVGIVRTATIEKMVHEGKIDPENFRIINAKSYDTFPYFISTGLYPEWPVSKLSHVSRDMAKEVSVALMQMSANDPAAKAAKIRGWTIPEDYRSVEEVLKQLALPPYEDFGKVTLEGVVKTYGGWLILFLVLFFVFVLLWLFTLKLNRDLKQKNIESHLNEEMFKGTFEQAAVGLLHVSTNGELIRFNHKLNKIIGYTVSEMQRLNLNDIISYKDVHRSLQEIDLLKQGKQNHFAIQSRVVHKEGHEIWTNLTVSAVTDDKGRVKYLIIVIDDISDIKELEQKISAEQHAKTAILETAGDGILGLDREGRHTFVNAAAAKMLGYESGEMIGHDSHTMWHHTKEDGTWFPGNECPITSVLEEGIVYRGENELLWRKDGTQLWVDYTSTPIIEDEVVGAVVVFREHKERNPYDETGGAQ
jgi:two-component system sensor histidine kinase TtrS